MVRLVHLFSSARLSVSLAEIIVSEKAVHFSVIDHYKGALWCIFSFLGTLWIRVFLSCNFYDI
uniref:Uncharacterized protein n=1 Tax=Rhizophora mucronata TaxID=61149 RepID=A0A2P2MBN6_RHIMU